MREFFFFFLNPLSLSNYPIAKKVTDEDVIRIRQIIILKKKLLRDYQKKKRMRICLEPNGCVWSGTAMTWFTLFWIALGVAGFAILVVLVVSFMLFRANKAAKAGGTKGGYKKVSVGL